MPRRTIATFWSINSKLSAVNRYHLGQLSVALFADSVVESGGIHYAIICDNDGLGQDEYARIPEIASSIQSLCAQPLITRTLTSFRVDMRAADRAAANQVAAQIQLVRDELSKRYVGSVGRNLGHLWRIGELGAQEFIDSIWPGGVPPYLAHATPEEVAGLSYVLSSPPVWFENYWVPAMLFVVGRLSRESDGPLEVVEGVRNSYPWLTLQAALSFVHMPHDWMQSTFGVTFRPNVESDGAFRSMCTSEASFALRVRFLVSRRTELQPS